MAEPKFKTGDKVKFVKQIFSKTRMEQGFCINDVFTITDTFDCRPYLREVVYSVKGFDDYPLYEREIELYDPDFMTVSVKLPLNDKKMAHRIVNNLVDSTYYAEKLRKEKAEKENRRWTPEEIQKAKNLCIDIVSEVVLNCGDVTWYLKGGGRNGIVCIVYPNCFSKEMRHGFASPHGFDEYNEWIGKCVSLCKAYGKSVPDFIKNKNMED